MAFKQDMKFGARYERFMHSMPTICPPTTPSIVAALSLPVMYVFDVLWPGLILGGVLLALVPQWDSCLFRLMDFSVCVLLCLVGVLGVLKLFV